MNKTKAAEALQKLENQLKGGPGSGPRPGGGAKPTITGNSQTAIKASYAANEASSKALRSTLDSGFGGKTLVASAQSAKKAAQKAVDYAQSGEWKKAHDSHREAAEHHIAASKSALDASTKSTHESAATVHNKAAQMHADHAGSLN